MAQTKLGTAYVLSAIIAILALVASAGGLFLDGPYRDNALVTAGWFGNDLVTLVVAVPVLVAALILSMRGSLARAGFPKAAAQVPIWGFLLVGSLAASGLLLRNVRSAQSGERGESR